MLFASGQSKHKATSPLLVVSFADEPTGDLPCILFSRGKESDVGTAERQRHTKRLSLRDNNVSTARAWRFEQAERHRFRDGNNQQCSFCMRCVGKCRQIFNATKEVW